MVSLQVQCHADTLRTDVLFHALLPQPEPAETAETGPAGPAGRTGGGLPVLYLLHGLSDDASAFLRFTALERHLAKYRVAAVMPSIGRSFGMDMRRGPAWGRFLAEELPHLAGCLLPLSGRPEDTFLAGVDAGGYAALRLALRMPERYAAVAALSAPLDLETLYGLPDEEIQAELAGIFGTAAECAAEGNLLPGRLAGAVREGAKLPRMYQACGTEDFFLPDNRRFADLAARLNAGLTWREMPGAHDWACWDAMLPGMLGWMFADGRFRMPEEA